MKIVKYISFLAISILVLYSSAYSVESSIGSSTTESFSKVGASGGQFLKIPFGARGSAMGGTLVSIVDDISAIYWNPAGLADVRTLSAEVSYNQWFADFQHQFAAISLPFGDNFAIAASFISFGCNSIEITTIDKPDGTGLHYSVQDLGVGLTFSGYLTEQFSFGITGKYVQNGFSTLTSNGMAFDVGTMYKTGISGIKLGFSIHNLGAEQKYSGQELRTIKQLYASTRSSALDAEFLAYPFSLPLIFRAGIGAEVYSDEINKVIAAADFITISDSPEQYGLGAEYTWNNLVAVRAGYFIGNDQFGMSFGAGLKYYGGRIDYSMNPTKDLGIVNRFTLAFDFGK